MTYAAAKCRGKQYHTTLQQSCNFEATKFGHGIMQNYACSAQFRSDIVQIRSESEVTVTLSSSTMLDVLINPPYLMLVLSKFHRSPVVVVISDGPPMGIKPQWGPSTDVSIWISWECVLGSRKIEQSSDRRMILMFEKRYNTLMFPISWSNLPPSAPRTRIYSCN